MAIERRDSDTSISTHLAVRIGDGNLDQVSSGLDRERKTHNRDRDTGIRRSLRRGGAGHDRRRAPKASAGLKGKRRHRTPPSRCPMISTLNTAFSQVLGDLLVSPAPSRVSSVLRIRHIGRRRAFAVNRYRYHGQRSKANSSEKVPDVSFPPNPNRGGFPFPLR